MSKDNMDNFNHFSHIDDEIYRPNVELSESIKSIMDSYKATLNVISYHDVIPDSLKVAADSLKDLFKAIDLERISALTNMQSLVQSVSDAASSLHSLYLQNSLDVIKGVDFSGLSSIGDMSQLIGSIPDDISADTVSELIENGEITDEDFRSELKSTITGTENKAVKDKPSLIKKALKFVAIQLIVFLMAALISPVTDKVKEEIIETLRVNEFWQSTGIIDWIDSWSNDNHTATEDEAKATVDESKTGNISKQKREDLLSKVKEIRNFISNAPQDENTGNLLSYLSEIEKDINGKKYGLVFEEHREDIDEVLETHTPVLTEETDLFIDNGGQMNFLIEGDNLASLKLLEKTHKGKIDLIYIDPPYNTGNKDFIYDDEYVDVEDGFRHSKWISFMSKRLSLARSLLSESGVIFIQISDIEIAQLRLLCDSIFGENNFLNIISVNMKNIAGASGGGEDKRIKKNCEYILIYAKDYYQLDLFNGAYEYEEIGELVERYRKEGISWKYSSALINPGEKIYVGSTVDGTGDEIKIYKRVDFEFKTVNQIMKDEGLTESQAYFKYAKHFFVSQMPQSSIRPRIMKKVNEIGRDSELYSIEYIPKSGRYKGQVYEQFYKGENFRLFAWLSDVTEEIDGKLYKKTLQGTYWNFVAGTKNLSKEGNIDFSNGKKPIDLLKRIVSLYPDNNITVLDFFAGSGSTGHAVISQNNEDGGTRSFILCTNNQNNICREKTYARLSNVINGYTTDKGKVFAPNPSTLKYYKVEYIPISERMYYEYADELLLHIRELVELENGINFVGNSEIAIVLTEEELDDFTQNIEQYSACRKLYMGHDLLPDEDQERIIEENNIEINIIPDYYYRDLQEA
jgi:adenine-specific DNA-methyltransferase